MNDFYKQPLFLQWLEAIILLIIGFYPAIVIIELTYNHFIYSILFLIFLPLGQFSLTPHLAIVYFLSALRFRGRWV